VHPEHSLLIGAEIGIGDFVRFKQRGVDVARQVDLGLDLPNRRGQCEFAAEIESE